jgi:hypothetical protein
MLSSDVHPARRNVWTMSLVSFKNNSDAFAIESMSWQKEVVLDINISSSGLE